MIERIIKEDTIHYCVYRLLDKNDEILYVGKSKQLKTRIFNHIRGHSNIPEECVVKIKRVEFLEFETKLDMDLFELYAISLFQPPYNKEPKSEIGLIRIEMPKVWNELLLDTFYKLIKVDIVKSKEETIKNSDNIDTEKLLFDRKIFCNERLAEYLDKHYDTILDENDQKELAEICDEETFNIDAINQIIPFNDSSAILTYDKEKIKLSKMKSGRNNFGSLGLKNVDGHIYLAFRFKVDSKIKCVYSNDRFGIANKVIDFYIKRQATTKLRKYNPDYTYDELLEEDDEDDFINNETIFGGINSVLYNKDNNSEDDDGLEKFLTKEEVMNHLQIKDYRTLNKIIDNYNLPHITVAGKRLFPLNDYNKWLKSVTIKNK